MLSPKQPRIFFCEKGFKDPAASIPPPGVIGIMVVRHPIDRVLSQMTHAWHLSPEALTKDIPRLNSLAYRWTFEKHSEYIRNKQVLKLAGTPVLPWALSRMQNFTAVIPTDKLNAGMASIAKALNLHIADSIQTRTHQNHNKGGSFRKYLNYTVHQLLLHDNLMDIVLYEKAKSLGRWEYSEAVKQLAAFDRTH
jgi:hypothetical protein